MTDNRIAEAFVEVRYGFDKLRSDLTQATGTIDRQLAGVEQATRGRFARIASAIGAPFAALSRSLQSVQGQVATLGGVLATALVTRAVVNTNIEFEKLSGSLETVTGSAEAGQAAFAALTKFAQQTPFALEESVTAFVRLQSLGIAPTEERLKSFGNTAAAFGKSLTQFIEATADAATGEFERLKEFGIRAKQQGDEVSFTFQGVTTTVGKNSAEIVEYLESIGNVNFGDAMANQMNRLPGLVSNLGDVFSGLARAVGTGGLNDGLKDLARTLIDVAEETEGVASEIGALIGGALESLASGIRSLAGWFADLSPEMKTFSVTLAAVGASIAAALPVLAIFAVSIGALLSPVGLVVTAIAAATAAILTFRSSTVDVLGVTVSVGGVLNAVWTTVSQSIAGTVEWAYRLLVALGRLATLDFAGALAGLGEAGQALRQSGDEIAQAWADAFVRAEDEVSDTFARIEQAAADAVGLPEADLGNASSEAAAAAASVRTIGDAIRDAKFGTMIAGLGAAGEEALETARALGLIRDIAGDLDTADPGSLFSVAPGASEDVLVLQRALQGLNAAREAAAAAAAKETELDQRAVAVKEDILTAAQRYSVALAELDTLQSSGRLSAEQYALAVAKLNKEFQKTETAADHMAKLKESTAALGAQMKGVTATTADFFIGFAQGMADYALTAGNMYEQAAQLGKKAMKGLEDALVEFATTGKLEVKDMVASILADLSRLAIQQGLSSAIGQLLPIATSALTAYFGGGTGTAQQSGRFPSSPNAPRTTGFAMGGTFKVGGGGGIDSQLVQFRATPGEIVDVHRGEGSIRSGSRGVSVSQSFQIDARGADVGVEARIRQAMMETVELTKAAVRDEATRSGRYGSAFG